MIASDRPAAISAARPFGLEARCPMTAFNWRSAAGAVVASALLAPAEAGAKIILITHGDTITHLGAANDRGKKFPPSVRVGYKHSYYGLFWIDFWTSDGTYCVYEGDRFAPISAAEAAELLGKREGDLSPPFLYQVPLGWLIFGPLIGIWIGVSAFKKEKPSELAKLFEDARYRKALDVLNEHYAQSAHAAPAATDQPEPASAAPAPAGEDERFQAAFRAGVQHLVQEGIDAPEAERNLGLMVSVMFHAGQPQAEAPKDGTPAQ
jgi:hypothetical protein